MKLNQYDYLQEFITTYDAGYSSCIEDEMCHPLTAYVDRYSARGPGWVSAPGKPLAILVPSKLGPPGAAWDAYIKYGDQINFDSI